MVVAKCVHGGQNRCIFFGPGARHDDVVAGDRIRAQSHDRAGSHPRADHFQSGENVLYRGAPPVLHQAWRSYRHSSDDLQFYRKYFDH